MATGSGKTLLMHVNYWQILKWLREGRHPEALVPRLDGRRGFDNVLLITTGEGMTDQHLKELRASGLPAVRLTDVVASGGQYGFGGEPPVKVVEIHKLSEEASRGGVSVPIDSLGAYNLVFVDEGHKGTGTEAQAWKDRQRRLSERGFLLEYSATFAQAIGAAPKKTQEELLRDYGRCILFDYSYRHFHGDGYGKDFDVLNLQRGAQVAAERLLVGGLLVFYEQLTAFRQGRDALRPYNIDEPLWVFLGHSVNAVYQREGQKQSDVATVVAFLRRFVEDRAWAVATVRDTLDGKSGFSEEPSGRDLFADRIGPLAKRDAAGLYDEILREMFHGAGVLEVWELKAAENEFGLKQSTGMVNFGVINIGDTSEFKKHLAEHLEIEVREDRYTRSLFDAVSAEDSRVFVLIGSKRFIEGWDCWRVSSMGLLNIGRGEGSQVIQLFGRGVRLRGRDMGLKRSSGDGEAVPAGLRDLETLRIVSWNADYLEQFRRMIELEDVWEEIAAKVQCMDEAEWATLPVPLLSPGYDAMRETWVLTPPEDERYVDLRPRVQVLKGKSGLGQAAVLGGRVRFRKPPAGQPPEGEVCYAGHIVDHDRLYRDLLEYKRTGTGSGADRGNVFIPRQVVEQVLAQGSVQLPAAEAADVEMLHAAARQLLRGWFDDWYAQRQREAQGKHLEPGHLSERAEPVLKAYTIRVRASERELLEGLRELARDVERFATEQGPDDNLPRLYVSEHLYNPVLLEVPDERAEHLSVHPPGLNELEADFVKELREFWKRHHGEAPYQGWTVYLLRNLPRAGVGFFEASGFYPDFIVWVKQPNVTRVVFVEPHGLHHGGLSGNRGKVEALRCLARHSASPAFTAACVVLDGYMVTATSIDQIPDATDWDAVEKQTGGRVQRWHEENKAAVVKMILGA